MPGREVRDGLIISINRWLCSIFWFTVSKSFRLVQLTRIFTNFLRAFDDAFKVGDNRGIEKTVSKQLAKSFNKVDIT